MADFGKSYFENRKLQEPIKTVADGGDSEVDWEELNKATKFTRYSLEPERLLDTLPDMKPELAMDISQARAMYDHGYAGNQQYTGQQLADAKFLTDFEREFQRTRGQIPLDWLADNWDDVHLINDDPEWVEEIYNLHTMQVAWEERAEEQELANQAFIERTMETYGVGRDEAEKYHNLYEQALLAGDERAAGIETLEDVRADMEAAGPAFLGRSPEERFNDYVSLYDGDEEAAVEAYRESVRTSAVREISNETIPKTPTTGFFRGAGGNEFMDFVQGQDFSAGATARDFTETVFQGVGNAITGGIAVVDWLVGGSLEMMLTESQEAEFDEGLKSFGSKFENTWSGTKFVQAKTEAKQRLKNQLGIPDAEKLKQLAMAPVEALWDYMNPEEQQVYLAMGGGDQALAMALLQSDVEENEEFRQLMEDQRRAWDEGATADLQKLEEEGFTIGGNLLSLISLWGEGTETLATMATVGTRGLFRLEYRDWEEGNYWKEVMKHDSPASVLGLEGTFVGLGFDLASTAIVDPTTWIWGPRLGKVRAGALTEAQITRSVNNPASTMLRKSVAETIYDGYRPNRASAATLDSLMETGHAGAYINAAGGFKAPLKGKHTWRRNPFYGKASEVANIKFLEGSGLLDDFMKRDGLEAAGKDIAEISNAVVIDFNPHKGVAQISSGGPVPQGTLSNGQILNHVIDNGYDQVPITIRRNLSLEDGVSVNWSAEWSAFRNLRMPNEIGGSWNQVLKNIDPADLSRTFDDVSEFANPSRIIDVADRLGPDGPNFEAMKAIERRHMQMGGDAISAQRSAMSIAYGRAYNATVGKTPMGPWVQKHFTPLNNNSVLSFNTVNAQQRINQVNTRLWGAVDDMDSLDHWSGTHLELMGEESVLKQSLDDLQLQSRVIKDWSDGVNSFADLEGFQNALLDAGEVGPVADAIVANYNQWRVLKKQATRETAKISNQMSALKSQLDGINTQYKAFLDEMLDDYNRKHIATNTYYKKFVDPETGLVPWEVMRKSSADPSKKIKSALIRTAEGKVSLSSALEKEFGFIPKAVRELIDKTEGWTGTKLEKFAQENLEWLKKESDYTLPMTPIELMTATSSTPQALRKLQHWQRAEEIRDMASTMHQWWMLEKVLTPKTALTVSLDELMRMHHTQGTRFLHNYLEDSVARYANRLATRKSAAGFEKLPARWQKRLASLDEWPDAVRHAEKSFLLTRGHGVDTLSFKKKGSYSQNIEYYEAASRYANQGFLQDESFRAFMAGREAFEELFMTSKLKELQVRSRGSTHIATMDELWEGWSAIVDQYVLGNIPSGKKAKARKIWKEAAEEAAESAKPIKLPDWVLEGFGEVTGHAKIPSSIGMALPDYVAERIFERPVNARRGYLTELVRETEWARLEELMKNRGISIVDDATAINMMAERFPVKGGHLANMDSITYDLGRENLITRRQLNHMVEAKAAAEAENMLYANHINSKMGRKGRAVFPFGKPWADMWGFWGRELMSKPALRGQINRSNYANFFDIGTDIVQSALGGVNPKTAGFISRVAAADYNLDRIQEDPLLGGAVGSIDSIDVGSGLFLPHTGETPFLSVFPGFGVAPTALGHWIFNANAPDPFEDPSGYQAYVDEWSQFWPNFAYNRPLDSGDIWASTVTGGGITSKLSKFLGDANLLASNSPSHQDVITGDWRSMVLYDRGVKNILAEPGVMEDLFNFENPDQYELGLEGLLVEELKPYQEQVARSMGAQLFVEHSIELGFPSNVSVLDTNDNSEDVWIDYAPRIPGAQAILSRYDLNSPEQRTLAAEAVNNLWREIDRDIQNALIAETPQLAVNSVSIWEWTDEGKNRLPFYVTEARYSIYGSTEGLDQHKSYVELGFVRPKQPEQLAAEIIGYVFEARKDTANTAYELAVTTINEARWEALPQSLKNRLQAEADFGNAEDRQIFPWETGKEIWENLSAVKSLYAERNWTFPVKVAQKDQKYSISVPSTLKNMRDALESGETLVPEDEKVITLLNALDIKWTPDMTVDQLWESIATYKSEQVIDNDAYSPGVTARSSELQDISSAARDELGRINTLLAPSVNTKYRAYWKETLKWADEAVERKRANDPRWVEFRDVAMERWGRMATDDYMQKAEMPEAWNKMYARNLGNYTWEPDTPVPLYNENGELTERAEQIFVKRVVDGDTIYVTTPNKWNKIFPEPQKDWAVRILGVNSPELGSEGGFESREELEDLVTAAIEEGKPIYIVSDPDRYGEVDFYGRKFAWLYIGDEAYNKPETQIPSLKDRG